MNNEELRKYWEDEYNALLEVADSSEESFEPAREYFFNEKMPKELLVDIGFMKEMVKNDVTLYPYVGEEIKGSKEIIDAVLDSKDKHISYAMQFFPEKYLDSEDIVDRASDYSAGAYSRASERLKNDETYALKMVKKNPWAIGATPLIKDPRFLVLAATSNPDVLAIMPQNHKYDDNVVKPIVDFYGEGIANVKGYAYDDKMIMAALILAEKEIEQKGLGESAWDNAWDMLVPEFKEDKILCEWNDYLEGKENENISLSETEIDNEER